MQPTPTPRSTPERLLDAATHLFGHRGFAETSTREIAALADTNVASIAYHFGGKTGLHEACARALAGRVAQAVVTPELNAVGDPEEAARRLEEMVRRFVAFIVAVPDAQDVVAFMLRAVSDPGDIAQLVYEEFLEPRHRAICALWGLATGQPAESEAVKLSVFAMIGQVVYFRIGRPFVLQRLGWAELGPGEAERIGNLLAANLRHMIERQRQ